MSFKEIITKHINKTLTPNDKRIMTLARDLIEDEPIITNEEIDIFKEIFLALKEDYTLSIFQDKDNLNYAVQIKEQIVPIIENKHDVNELCNELLKENNTNDFSKIEKVVLIFLYACEHIEENEIYIIQQMIKYLERNWTFSPISNKQTIESSYRYTNFIPVYQKQLTK